MTYIEARIKPARDLIGNAFRKLLRFQKGVDKPIKTPFPHLNDNLMGGMYPGDVITICGISGSGKTYNAGKIEDAIFDKTLNPDCDEYFLLKFNWEMSIFKLLLRKLSRRLRRKMSDILQNEYLKEEEYIYRKIKEEEQHDNIFYCEDPLTPEEFYSLVDDFCNKKKKAKRVVISVDHMALVIGSDKKKAIDDLIEKINLLKKKHENTNYILLSQLNREIEKRKNPREHAPNRGDLYQSDFIYHISDLVLCIHQPSRLYINPYMSFNQEAYSWLEKYKSDSKRSFLTKGLIFFHYIKMRELDAETDRDIQDLFIEVFPKWVDEYDNRFRTSIQNYYEVEKEESEETEGETDQYPFRNESLPF